MNCCHISPLASSGSKGKQQQGASDFLILARFSVHLLSPAPRFPHTQRVKRFLRWLAVIALFSLSWSQSQARELNILSTLAANQARISYPFRLVDLRAVVPDIKVDLRYRSKRNLLGRPLYPENMPCLLFEPTAKKLAQAQQILKQQGYQLLIWDAWRPTEVQSSLYEANGQLFANPNIGWSFHCLGVAVDVTLLDAKGRAVKMPSDFDETDPIITKWTLFSLPEVKSNLQILKNAIHQAGFAGISKEWWHFEDGEFRSKNKPKAVPARAIGLRLP